METIEANSSRADSIALLLERGDNYHRPTLENRVAYQFELDGDIVGHFSGGLKNQYTLSWLADAIRDGHRPAAVLDIGCAYGNMMLMLNAALEKPKDVKFVGIDLYEDGLNYPVAFASEVAGYENCSYQTADLSQQLPFDAESFDAVNLGDVLEHMEDPRHALSEIKRILKPRGIVIISTPLKGGLFKKIAGLCNFVTGGLLYRHYYRGKSTQLDAAGRPVMETHAGHDHISEMSYAQLSKLLESVGFAIEKVQPMTIMSGSKWFDKHLFLVSVIFFLEGLHRLLGFKSWAHSVMLLARKPGK
jgi:SAM-dependent methyltransferase